jgi:putative membrane protein
MKLFGLYDGHQKSVLTEVDTAKMTLRDHLAAFRTTLSNQNTFLAYIRTALTLVGAGITFVHFFEVRYVEILGWVFIPTGILTFIVGFLRYNRLRVKLRRLRMR